MAAGKPQRQAIAIAMDVARRSKRKSGGLAYRQSGGGSPPWYVRNEDRALRHNLMHGPIMGTGLGRADSKLGYVGSHSHVIPAHVVSAIGQGNTLSGMKTLHTMFGTGPYGSPKTPMHPGHLMTPPKLPSGATSPRLTAEGGERSSHIGQPVPVALSDGEYTVPPEAVVALGGGNEKHGHEILDRFIVNQTKKLKKTVAKLPGPAKR